MSEQKPLLVVFTGSGVSAESGLATFHDKGGTWEKFDVKDVCTADALLDNRDLVFKFFNDVRTVMSTVEPNIAHREIAALEKEFEVVVVTQNVDDLHERAGSTRVIHLHGEITKKRDVNTDEIVDWDGEPLDPDSSWRPHVVMFGEDPYNYAEAEELCEVADYGLIIGTSLQVYPAAMLPYRFSITSPIILVDPNPPIDSLTFPNISVIPETAVDGIAQAANLLLVDLQKQR